MFEEQLSSERRFLDLWLESNFPAKTTTEGQSFWSRTDAEWPTRENSHFAAWEVGPSAQDSWQNVRKSFLVLTFLCSEVHLLEQFAQKKFYPVLYVIGGSLVRGHFPPMGDLELQLANLLPTLQDVLDFLEQLDSLLGNLLCQSCAIVLDDALEIKRKVISTALKCASRGLVVLFTLQTLVSLKILPLFFNYRRMLHTMMSKTNRHGAELGLLEEVQEQVVRLEESLRLGAFTSFIDSKIKHGVIGKHFQRKALSSLMESYFLESIEYCFSQLDTANENVFARSDLLATLALFVGYCWAAGGNPKDKKVLKAVLEIHQRAPLLPLYSNLVVVPARFLLDMLPASHLSSLPYDYLKQANLQSNAYLQTFQKAMSARLDKISFRGAVWATELCALISEGEGSLSAADREQFLTLLMEGLHMMTHLRKALDQMVQLHVEQLQPMSRDTLRCVTSCICYLKLLSGHIARSWNLIEENMEFFLEHYKLLLLDQFKKAHDHLIQLERNDGTLRMRKVLNRLGASYQYSPEYLTVCAKLIKMGIQSLQEKASTPQRLLLNFILHSITEFQIVPDSFEIEGLACLKQMEVTEEIGYFLQKMGRCDSLYFHPELMRNAFQLLLQHPEEANKLPHLVNGFLDVRFLGEEAGVHDSASMFENDVTSMMKVYFLDPLSRIIERDLLKLVCVDYLTSTSQRTEEMECQNNVLPLLQLGSLSLISRDLNISDVVKTRLALTLRKLTSRGEIQWEDLSRVKNMAQEKYGMTLELLEPFDGSTPTTLDRLGTMEGVRAFVASYMFQLHSFSFVLSPRTPSNPRHDLPEVVGIEDFMELVQADITQVGCTALASLTPQNELVEVLSEPSPVVEMDSGQVPFSPSPKSEEVNQGDAQGRQEGTSDGRGSVSAHFQSSGMDSFKKSPSIPITSLNPDISQWTFLEKSKELSGGVSIGSGNSLRPATSAQGLEKDGRITTFMSILKTVLKEKLSEISDLCSASETRSVLSQTSQRWQNSQKAVGYQYPVPQAELVRKEVMALMKAGTLTTNIIHKLRFLIGDIGKIVSMVMLVFHGAASVRDRTFVLFPRDVLLSYSCLTDFLEQISVPEKIYQEGIDIDLTFSGFKPLSSVHVRHMALLEPVFDNALDDHQLEVLRNLFVLAPAMSLDHIESMRSLKNQYQGSSLNKITANTEDSFAVGLAFVLSMLNQTQKFDACHWFESSCRQYHMRLDRTKAIFQTQRASAVPQSLRRPQDTETQRNLALIDTIKGTITELRLLEHSFLCATVLLKRQSNFPRPPTA